MSAGDTSALDLDAIEARASAASSGPWHTEDDGDDGPGGVFGPSREFVAETYTGESSGGIVAEAITGGPQQQRANATFVAHTRTDVPALLAEVRRLRGQLAACVDALGVTVPPDATAADAIVDEHQRATGEARALRLARDAAEEEVRRLRAPLDLDAIEKRSATGCDMCDASATRACDTCRANVCDGHASEYHGCDTAVLLPLADDVRDLAAEVRRLRALLDATAQAYDDLVARVWAATGETHEPPADVEALVARVTGLRESHRERGEALLTMTRRALDAERLLDSTESTEREEELARQIRATARREGAEAMREACVARVMESARAGVHRRSDAGDAVAEECSDLADALRALPLPEGSDAGPRGATYRAGAEAMRDALVSALDAMVHAEATEAELFRLTRNGDSAAEHHYKRAVLLEARVTALSLPLPEVTP